MAAPRRPDPHDNELEVGLLSPDSSMELPRAANRTIADQSLDDDRPAGARPGWQRLSFLWWRAPFVLISAGYATFLRMKDDNCTTETCMACFRKIAGWCMWYGQMVPVWLQMLTFAYLFVAPPTWHVIHVVCRNGGVRWRHPKPRFAGDDHDWLPGMFPVFLMWAVCMAIFQLANVPGDLEPLFDNTASTTCCNAVAEARTWLLVLQVVWITLVFWALVWQHVYNPTGGWYDGQNPRSLGTTVRPLLIVTAVLLAGTLGAPWLLSVKLSSAIALDSIASVEFGLGDAWEIYNNTKNVTAPTVHGDVWETKIRMPVVHVARVVMPALSEWSAGITFVSVGFFALSFSEAMMLARQHRDQGGMTFPTALNMLLLLLVPALLAWVPAQATSACLRMQHKLNDLRSADDDADLHSKLGDVELYLSKLNGEQGIGFAIFGYVVSTGTLSGLLGSLFPTVLALVGAAGGDHAGEQESKSKTVDDSDQTNDTDSSASRPEAATENCIN